jgi:outer membrane receptor protein involved in Fe transport
MNGNLGLHYAFDLSGHEAFVRTDVLYVGKIYESLAEQGPNTQAGDYVKLDASARVRIGEMNFDFYIHNLTNEDAFTARSGVAGLSGGEFYGYRLRPRTIGVQLGYEF